MFCGRVYFYTDILFFCSHLETIWNNHFQNVFFYFLILFVQFNGFCYIMFWCFKKQCQFCYLFFAIFLLFLENYFLRLLLISFDLLNQILSLTYQLLTLYLSTLWLKKNIWKIYFGYWKKHHRQQFCFNASTSVRTVSHVFEEGSRFRLVLYPC